MKWTERELKRVPEIVKDRYSKAAVQIFISTDRESMALSMKSLQMVL